MAEVKTIGRNPFGRFDIVRQRVSDTSGGCDWCGQLSAKGKLYQYGTLQDGIHTRPQFTSGKFCSHSCCKSYHS